MRYEPQQNESGLQTEEEYLEYQDSLPEHKRDGYVEELYEKAEYERDIRDETAQPVAAKRIASPIDAY